ncbi:putative leucine--tRNA ligase, mitochondrial [Holothuria leucospilota]|uniref:leucine--tRNA ligase n=1 Tax=Holothuria leucospilota TaxID=206669 RepID=A0A9Q1CAI7_HOLLE|nr:putative leucine--tRNA ligase, mitochondrial [Holothuria leucospilota]
MWSLVTNFRDVRSRHKEKKIREDFPKDEKKLNEQMNFTIKEVSHQYTTDFMLSVAISRLMTFTNTLRGCSDALVASSPVYEQALCNLCIMVAPMAPLMASEMWQGLAKMDTHLTEMAWDKGVLEQAWPEAGEIEEEEKSHVTLIIKINNTNIGNIDLPKELLKDEDQLKRFILQSTIGKSHLDNQIIKRTIIAPKVPLVNFLIDS